MISRRLLRHTLDIVYRDPGTEDRYGTPALTETSRATVQGWMQMTDSTELVEGEAGIVGWRLFLNPTYLVGSTVTPLIPPSAHDLIEYDGRTFEIQGGPMTYLGTRRGTVHHHEVALKEVVLT